LLYRLACLTKPILITLLAAAPSLALATDGGPPPDAAAPKVCNATCVASAKHLCAYDSKRKRCVECTADVHCAKNPAAFGSTCDTSLGICTCSTSSGQSCAGKVPGTRCISTPYSPLCGCSSGADCGPTRKCLGQAFGVKVCAAPCKVDKDCPEPSRPFCVPASGACVACRTAGDCHGPFTPRCDATLGRCVQCLTDGQCTGAGKPRCDRKTGKCEQCTDDTQCPGATGEGAKCLLGGLGNKRCGCKTDQDCAGNKYGPTCDAATGLCSCAADTQCKAPLLRCAPVFVGAARKRCTGTCSDNKQCGAGLRCLVTSGGVCGECNKDAHCAGSARPFCDAKQRRCVACKVDSDCTSKSAPLCDAKLGKCVACKTTADCKASADGAICAAGACTCAADSDCAGVGRWGAKCVSHGGIKRCGCAAASQCKGNVNGGACALPVGKCSCKADTECKAGVAKCRSAYPGAKYKVCLDLCKKDSDCASKETPRCDTKTGHCVTCTADAHCAATPWEKRCDTTRRRCVECVTNAHCTSSTLGKNCKGGLCVCGTSADCAGNVHGPVCDKKYRSCTCTTDKECAAGKKCKQSKLGTKVKLCQ